MDKDSVIFNAKKYVKEIFCNDFSGHDYWHTIRVFKMAENIGKSENADLFIVQLSALLHDIDDVKLSPSTHLKKDNAIKFMVENKLEDEIILRVNKIIDEISFSGKHIIPTTIEGKCVQDADRLDALGAIGISRAFAYGGYNRRVIYDPYIKAKINMTKEEYRKSNSTTINHFYEKLFKLKDLMNTNSAKEIAKKREDFMKSFIEEFMNEWDGLL